MRAPVRQSQVTRMCASLLPNSSPLLLSIDSVQIICAHVCVKRKLICDKKRFSPKWLPYMMLLHVYTDCCTWYTRACSTHRHMIYVCLPCFASYYCCLYSTHLACKLCVPPLRLAARRKDTAPGRRATAAHAAVDRLPMLASVSRPCLAIGRRCGGREGGRERRGEGAKEGGGKRGGVRRGAWGERRERGGQATSNRTCKAGNNTTAFWHPYPRTAVPAAVCSHNATAVL